MPGKKRANDAVEATKSAKKARVAPIAVEEVVDFPRGGGTTLTASEVKALRTEAIKEADEDLFKNEKSKSKKKSSQAKSKTPKSDVKRIEHLNYKRLTVGMRLLGQVISVQPLALIVSLPNQLFGHVPITNITTQLTSALEKTQSDSEDDEDEDEDMESSNKVPELSEIFRVGQYVRAAVSQVHAAGSTSNSILERSRDEAVKASRRVELSLLPNLVNKGVQKADLRPGFTLNGAVSSKEDHGYIIDLGIPDVSGFLPLGNEQDLLTGTLLDVCVVKLSSNQRTCTVTSDPSKFASSSLTEITSVDSVIPGSLVQAMVTATSPAGHNLQILGYFDGTAEATHLSETAKKIKVGKKAKGRILYELEGSPPTFAVAFSDHILGLKRKEVSSDMPFTEAFPLGTILDQVEVVDVETERGVIVDIGSDLQGFIHISQLSDEHIASLSKNSGTWKVGTHHKARVIGSYPLDGLLQLSLRPSILAQKFVQVSDVQVGEIIKGTIKTLTSSGLFVTLSGKLDGVVWPNHYADIALKHPEKRFKPGASIKCRVLAVDPTKNKISLSVKKSLLDMTLPALVDANQALPGLVTLAVVYKITPRGLLVEFFNNISALVTTREASEAINPNLPEMFPLGRTVKVVILKADASTGRITASIRQTAANASSSILDLSGISVDDKVNGTVAEVHKEHVLLTLQPLQIRALLSLSQLAKHRQVPVASLKASLQIGDSIQSLLVSAKEPAKGIVIVTLPKTVAASKNDPTKEKVDVNTLSNDQIISGRVMRHIQSGALVKIGPKITGSLNITDLCDNFDSGVSLPAVGSGIKASVIFIDKNANRVSLSTRDSRIFPEKKTDVVDPEVVDIGDLKVGQLRRGFIKTVADHGIFVTIGRNVDARVQIKELFDDYIKDWKPHFKVAQCVLGRIVSLDLEQNRVEMSLKTKSDATGKENSTDAFGEFEENQKVDGSIRAIKEYGLFIDLNGTKVSGLCHISELSDNKDADTVLALRSFREGDRVKVLIISVDKEKRKISLGMKPSYFDEADFQDGQEIPANMRSTSASSNGLIDLDEEEVDDTSSDDDAMSDAAASSEDPNGVQDGEQSEDLESDVDMQPPPLSALGGDSALKLSRGFNWNADPEEGGASDDASSASDEEENPATKKKKRAKKAIEYDLTADMHTKTPESNADFERLLLGSPNSSYLWMQYIAFQLQLSEIDKAREIGRRAVAKINFREEQERFNVWVALLNLENVYGDDEALEKVFQDAARHNDAKTVYLRMASILEQSNKFEKSDEQYKRIAKKFSHSSKVWVLWAEYLFRRTKVEEARALLPRSLKSLENRKHLKTISRFAQLEYKLGEPERGKTIFEGVVDSHPKRWDMWTVYMDMEKNQKDIQSLRNLFRRIFEIKMTSHKAKAFFKKWLEIEKTLGDEEGVEAVKERALEWTQKIAETSTV